MNETLKLAFLPWFTLQGPAVIGEVTFTPFSISDGDPESIFADFRDDIVRILSGYRGIKGEPIESCTLAYIDYKVPCNKSADDRLIANAAHLLAFAGIAQNEYCVNLGNYINSSCFQSVTLLFSKDKEYLTLNNRRRDGSSYLKGMKHGEVIFSIPHQCAHVKPPAFDDNFLTSLGYVLHENDPLSKRMVQSIRQFNEACSDSYMISFEREVVLFASAFEQLFGCENCYQITQKLGELLKDYNSVMVENSSRYEDIILTRDYEDAEKKWCLYRKWIQEMYQLRSCYVHGLDTSERSWGWNDLEHTLMASFAFPLIVKLLLAQESKYVLTETDEVHLGAIDKLLDAQGWFEPKDPSKFNSNWRDTISDSDNDYKLERTVEKYVGKHHSQENGESKA